MKIAVVANSAWYLYNFRRTLMRALARAGHEPIAVSPIDPYAARLTNEGFPHRTFPLAASGTNPVIELGTVRELHRLLKHEAFGAAFTYTPKANIYTGLAARGLAIRHVPNVSGLGRVFTQPSMLTPIVRQLYRLAFRRACRVIFQNEEDRSLFIEMGLAPSEKTTRVPGSGVDLQHFRAAPKATIDPGVAVFLLVARMLWAKGVGEFVEVARRVREDCPGVSFRLLGPSSAGDDAAVPPSRLGEWMAQGVVAYTSLVDDVRPAMAEADCVVLPSSYREGVPRSLLEAASMSRPLITSDTPGCRDTVDHGVNGFLCRPADANSLEVQIRRFLASTPAQRMEMGRQSRLKAERQFDEQLVLSAYLELLQGWARPSR